MGKKGKIILGLAVGAMIPAMMTGCGHKHAHSEDLKYNETQHYYECSCGNKKDAENHEASTIYQSSDTHHWKDCVDCGYDLNIEQHNFNQEVVASSYLKTPATTTARAVYYKSCECGKAGTTETFESGKKLGAITNLAIANKIYDGQPIATPTYDKNTNGTVTIEYKLKSANDSTYSTTAPTDAGEYTARVSIAESDDYSSVTTTKDFTISKYVISNLTKDFIYNGEAVRSVELPDDMNLPDDNVKMEIVFASANAASSVTEVKVLVNDIESGNYEVKNCTATISKATVQFSNVAMSSVDIIYGDNYNVQSQSIANFYESTPDGFIVQEYYVDGHWTTERPTDAGSYKARLRVLDSTNYNGVFSDEEEFEIKPYKIAANTIEVTYCGGVEFFKILEFNALDLRFNFNLNDKNVGARSMTSHSFTLNEIEVDNDNFDVSELTFEIKAKPITINWQTNNEPLYFIGEPIEPSYEFDEKCEGDDLTANLSVFDGDNNTYDSTFIMAATLSGADASNYVLQNEHSGVYTIGDLDEATLCDSLSAVSLSDEKTECYKINLQVAQYALKFKPSTQGATFTIGIYKKDGNTLIGSEFTFTNNVDNFDNVYFQIEQAGEYYIKCSQSIDDCQGDEFIIFQQDDYGFCSICGEYMGDTYSLDDVVSKTVTSGQKYYFRVQVTAGADVEYAIVNNGTLTSTCLKVYYLANANPRDMEEANIQALVFVEKDDLNPGVLDSSQTNPLIETDGYLYFVLEGPMNTSLKICAVDVN